jgi:hypothetical protein
MDLLFVAHNRYRFTKLVFETLIANTDWSLVDNLVITDDESCDGTREYLAQVEAPVPIVRMFGRYGSPVTVMNTYLQAGFEAPIFVKIDSDTMVPPGWLNETSKVMRLYPELDLLGIEAFRPVVAGEAVRTYDEADFIGGIGLMRKRAFCASLPRANGRFGFTAWQERTKHVTPGWLNPALPVFLLDRMPMEPFVSLSADYEKRGWQRPWPKYTDEQAVLWGWWKP